MRKIVLTQGKTTIVDDQDFEILSQISWYYHKGYAARTEIRDGKRHTLYMHRLLMKPPKGMIVDHINGNKLDNRRKNLRICNRAENNRNMIHYRSRKRAVTHSKYKGVYWVGGKKNPWVAQIRYNKRQIHLGYFSTEKEAALAYDQAAFELFGPFACPNFQAEGETPVCPTKTNLKPYSLERNGRIQEMETI